MITRKLIPLGSVKPRRNVFVAIAVLASVAWLVLYEFGGENSSCPRHGWSRGKNFEFLAFWNKITKTDMTSPTVTPKSAPRSTSRPPPSSNEISCPMTRLDPFDPAVMKHLIKPPALDCSKGLPSLVYLHGGKLHVNVSYVQQTVGHIDHCVYAALELSVNDSVIKTPTWSSPFRENPIHLEAHEEHIQVRCFLNGEIVGETFKSRVVEKPSIEKRRVDDFQHHMQNNSPLETLNILILGIDGTSKQNFARFMPQTRTFITERLRAKELHLFNKVGHNTFPNVVAFNTGRNETDLEKVWDRNRDYFDVVDDLFLWREYQNAGYRTAVSFDITAETAFHYLKKGWRRPSFDFYSRPVNLGIDHSAQTARKAGLNCVGNVPELTVIHDFLLQLVSEYENPKETPYFSYNFYTRITHDFQELASLADPLYLSLFQQLEQRKVLNNTLMVFFSDHGARFGEARKTLNGKMEVNSPFVYFIFPRWFEEKYPAVMNTFYTNQHRLTTFFDLHKTVHQMLNFQGKTGKGDLSSVGISLFDEIPAGRSCLHANIPLEFCNCLNLKEPKTLSQNVTQTLASYLLGLVVNKTAEERHLCADLGLKSVPSVLLAGGGAQGGGGGGGGGRGGEGEVTYKVVIETTPGDAQFEALLAYYPSSASREVRLVGDMTRLTQYEGQDKCVDTQELKSYCFCRS